MYLNLKTKYVFFTIACFMFWFYLYTLANEMVRSLLRTLADTSDPPLSIDRGVQLTLSVCLSV